MVLGVPLFCMSTLSDSHTLVDVELAIVIMVRNARCPLFFASLIIEIAEILP